MRKSLFLNLLFALFVQLLVGQTVQNNALEQFMTEKFGMFLHWGLYA